MILYLSTGKKHVFLKNEDSKCIKKEWNLIHFKRYVPFCNTLIADGPFFIFYILILRKVWKKGVF